MTVSACVSGVPDRYLRMQEPVPGSLLGLVSAVDLVVPVEMAAVVSSAPIPEPQSTSSTRLSHVHQLN